MADTVGNRLGRRAIFVYESDNDTAYNMRLDESVAMAVGNDRSNDADRPVLPASQSFPIRPRYLLLAMKDDPNVKKKVIVGDRDSSLWTSNGASEVLINSKIFIVTARVGERRSTVRLVPLTTPA